MAFFWTFGQSPDLPIREIYLPDNIDSANCIISPNKNIWDVKIGWASAPIICDFNIPLVGDLNDDGSPEIVCFTKDGYTETHNPNGYTERYDNELIVFDGFTKHVKALITLPEEQKITANDAAAYGLIKTHDRKGLIVTACHDYYLRAYDITRPNPSEPYWVSDVPYGSVFSDWAVNIGFADFNSDGIPEVYVRNKIYNAETGKLLVEADGPNTGSSYGHWSHQKHYKISSPYAANVLGDDNLELILGNRIYSVDITNPNGQSSNSISLVKQITPPEGAIEDGHPQVADFNTDGYMDIFISVRDVDAKTGIVYGYVWDVHNDYISEPFAINTSFSGKSIPMIGDIDNDNLIEVLIQSGVQGTDKKFQAYKYHPDNRTFTYLWGIDVKENSYSNSITAFDFNQDGLLELIICDEEKLRIVNGSGKSHITHNDTIPVYIMESFPYEETTIMQYPVIVDVDDDGMAEIVSVGSDKLNFLESDGDLWAPARKVWNQYMYNVTNVNNDLTVTQHQFNNATPFTDPYGVVCRPFNNFLQQVTTLDKYGQPFFAAPDITFDGIIFDNFVLNVEYSNNGDNILFAPYYITVYANEYGGEIITTHTVNIPLRQKENAIDQITLDQGEFCGGTNVVNDLVIALNCSGMGIAQNGGNQAECDTTNNIGIFDFSGYNSSYDTTYIDKIACNHYVWYDVMYYRSGIYTKAISNDYGCDSIFILNLTIVDSLDLQVHGKTQVAVANDMWSGIYNYCVADSLELEDCELSWKCSNPEWILLPTNKRYWCKLLVTTLGEGSLTVHANCINGCSNRTSIDLYASHIGIDEFNESSIDIYPNPANTTLTIRADMLSDIRIFNSSGQTVKYIDYTQSDMAVIDVQDLPRGLYFVEIKTLTGIATKKVVLTNTF